jgi:hypothetical protein
LLCRRRPITRRRPTIRIRLLRGIVRVRAWRWRDGWIVRLIWILGISLIGIWLLSLVSVKVYLYVGLGDDWCRLLFRAADTDCVITDNLLLLLSDKLLGVGTGCLYKGVVSPLLSKKVCLCKGPAASEGVSELLLS